jgi:hypothetical protein
MFAGCLQIMWAHSHLIRVESIGYLQLIRAENADVCRSYGLCLQAATTSVTFRTVALQTPSPLKIIWDFGVVCLNSPKNRQR